MKIKYLAIILAIFLSSAYVESKTYEVPSCSEFRSALNEAGDNDVIQFGEGDFRCAFDTKRDGVTFRGAPNYKTRLLYSSGSSGKQIIGIKHDNIVIENLMLDGEKRHNSGHGLIRVGTSKGVRIFRNKSYNSGSSHINVGGSFKRTTIKDIQIIGNYLCGSGYQGEYGEAIYLGDYAGSGSVDTVLIAGNETCRMTDNAVDIKPPVRNAKIIHNFFHDQEDRTGKEINTGVLVVQGRDIDFSENYLKNVIPGKAVFNLNTRGDIVVEKNVVQEVRKAQTLVRSRGGGSGGATSVKGNLFCQTGGTHLRSVAGMSITGNTITDSPSPCEDAGKRIIATMKQYQVVTPIDPPPPPVPLPPLTVKALTWGETCAFCLRVYTAPVEPGVDTQMDKREYRDGSVVFYSISSNGLTFYRAKRAKPEHPDGWTFYLDEPYPDGPIRMVAESGWITGTESIDRVIPRWGQTDPEPLPTVDVAPGQSARCSARFGVQEQVGGDHQVECGK